MNTLLDAGVGGGTIPSAPLNHVGASGTVDSDDARPDHRAGVVRGNRLDVPTYPRNVARDAQIPLFPPVERWARGAPTPEKTGRFM